MDRPDHRDDPPPRPVRPRVRPRRCKAGCATPSNGCSTVPPPTPAPPIPTLKQDHLCALALLALVNGQPQRQGQGQGGDGQPAPAAGNPDLIVVVDEQTLRNGISSSSTIDLGGAEAFLPVETLRRIACLANIIPVVLNSDGVAVDLGHTTRLATRAQRRAMRAMYPTCGIHGCRVPFEQCVLHHIRLLGERRHHRPRQHDPAVLETPPRRPRRRLATHPPPHHPPPHHHLPRRHHPNHRPTTRPRRIERQGPGRPLRGRVRRDRCDRCDRATRAQPTRPKPGCPARPGRRRETGDAGQAGRPAPCRFESMVVDGVAAQHDPREPEAPAARAARGPAAASTRSVRGRAATRAGWRSRWPA